MGLTDPISNFSSLHPGDIAGVLPESDFDILRIPLGFDPADLAKRLSHLRAQEQFPWQTKGGHRKYEAIALQYSSGPAFYSEAIAEMTIETFKMCEKKNLAASFFDHIFLRCLPTRLFRTRLLTAQPGFEMQSAHDDGCNSFRLHIPIETNPQSWMEIEGRRYHMPADGSAYLVNTSRRHRIGNGGGTNRTHLVCVIYPSFPSLIHFRAQASLIRFIEASKGLFSIISAAAYQQSGGHCDVCHRARTLYAIPISRRELKTACAQCIETAARTAARTAANQCHNQQKNDYENDPGREIDQFETELNRSTANEPKKDI